MSQNESEAPQSRASLSVLCRSGPTVDGPILTDRPVSTRVHQQRQVRRLAVIALVRAAYGPDADMRLLPPGPEACPPGCPYCWAGLVVA